MKQLLNVPLILLLFSFILPSYAKTVFILIHGTWAKQAWYLPDGDFFNAVEQRAQQYNAVVVPYCWSGKNNYKARINAAKSLVRLIQSYPPETTLCLITHSHGGNIGIIASQLLACIPASNKINIFYALGTPVNTKEYQPNMNTIHYFYNFFSFEDFIQPVLGFFEREYLPHERIINIRITINKKEPSHTKLHSPLVGQWLPFLHEFLTTFIPLFDFTHPGIIHFANNQNPYYEIDNKRKHLLSRDKLLTKMIVTSFFRK
ncbi:MAG: hypothetical protein WCD44_04125 [Candidatus Babeliales bacterium]